MTKIYKQCEIEDENILNFYSLGQEKSRFKRKTRRIEFDTTIFQINQYIEKNNLSVKSLRILDICAGPGAYVDYFAKQGAEVYALDFSNNHVKEIQNEICSKYNNVKCYQCDARELNKLDRLKYMNDSFDIVLNLGTLYHLSYHQDRYKVMNNIKEFVKKDGIIISNYISAYATYMINLAKSNTLSGALSSPSAEESPFYLSSPKEMKIMHRGLDLKVIKHFAQDGLYYICDDLVDNLNEEEYNRLLETHIKICEDENTLGASCHVAVISSK